MKKRVVKKPSAKASDSIKRRASTSDQRVHIVSSGQKWAVRKEGASKASKVVGTKKQAVEIAKSYVKNGSAKTIISHKKDGSFTRLR